MSVNVTNLRLFQLVVTVMFISVVIYLYTVIAFNFFRKFYTKVEDGGREYKCNGMLSVSNFSIIPLISSFSRRSKRYLLSPFAYPQCFVFHLHMGLQAGGGIGDEIEPPDGDAHEALRILFDMSFFFFVIIILLAIIQGLCLPSLLLIRADHLDY